MTRILAATLACALLGATLAAPALAQRCGSSKSFEVGAHGPKSAAVPVRLATYDQNKDGAIDATEIAAACACWDAKDARARPAFAALDKDQSGKLDAAEFKAWVKAHHPAPRVQGAKGKAGRAGG